MSSHRRPATLHRTMVLTQSGSTA